LKVTPASAWRDSYRHRYREAIIAADIKNHFGRLNMAGYDRLLGPVVLAFGLFPLSPVAATAPVPMKSPAGPVITGVKLNPASTLLQQPCPVVLVFHGDITTTRSALVTYTWVDSHGRAWPEHRRRLSLPGVSAVSHKWKLGRPGRTVDEWVQLKIISPEQRLSNKVPVRFTCTK
jgi:hypothetical protein